MQNEFQANIFTPNTGFDWRLNSNRLFFGGFILLASLLLLAHFFDFDTETVQGTSFGLMLLIIIGSWWGYDEKEKKFGKLEGEIKIGDDGLLVNGVRYPWNKISNFSFNLFQVLDEQLWSENYPIVRYYGGPAFSAGVDNYVDFIAREEHHRIYFQLKTPSQKVELSNILRRQYYFGNIDLQPLYNGLHLDYEQIQELKKEKALHSRSALPSDIVKP